MTVLNIILIIIASVIGLAVFVFALLQAVYWLNIDNKIMFLLYKLFNRITDRVPRDRKF